MVLGPPLTGAGWVALNGCCEPGFPHRGSDAPINGRIVNGQRFAIDWKRMNDQGAFYVGDKTRNESFVDYGADVLAGADGIVVETLDTLEPNLPGILPAKNPVLPRRLTLQTVDGNHIVVDLRNGLYAFYAHLLRGSLRVKKGDPVKRGDRIAKLGNTGNANVSHLHFHVMDGPSAVGSHGAGQISAQHSSAAAVVPNVPAPAGPPALTCPPRRDRAGRAPRRRERDLTPPTELMLCLPVSLSGERDCRRPEGIPASDRLQAATE